MKIITLFIVILLLRFNIYAQVNDTSDIIIDPFEQWPIFPGGEDSLWCFLESNYRYDIMNADTEAVRYILKFVIDTSGLAKDFSFVGTIPRDKIIQNDSLQRKEILRVLNRMPHWEPAEQNSKKVSVWFSISINTPVYFRCKKFADKEQIEPNPDRLAVFAGGIGITNKERINDFIYKRLKWIEEYECYGRVEIKCVIEKTGELNNFQYLKKLCPEYDQEALRVIKLMPNWIPAIKNGQPVRTYVVIPILFRLQ
jgi:periplasmic protein TonB